MGLIFPSGLLRRDLGPRFTIFTCLELLLGIYCQLLRSHQPFRVATRHHSAAKILPPFNDHQLSCQTVSVVL